MSSIAPYERRQRSSLIFFALGLILLAAFRPQGIFGNKEEMALDDR